MSINTLDEDFRKDMDNASSIADRLNTLKVLHENGIYTVLFMSPIFPMITDFQKIIEIYFELKNKVKFENYCTSHSIKHTNYFYHEKLVDEKKNKI